MRCNDNGYIFNRMLGYNTAFFDTHNKRWLWDEVNSNAATYYIQFGEKHFDYLQPVRLYDDLFKLKDYAIVVRRSPVSHPGQVLECIVKHILPLYIHVMAKNKSCETMLPSSSNITFNTHKDEFNIKTNKSLKLLLLQDEKGVIQSHVDFSKKGNYKALYSKKFRTYMQTYLENLPKLGPKGIVYNKIKRRRS